MIFLNFWILVAVTFAFKNHDLLLTARSLSCKILGVARYGREKNSGIVGLWNCGEIAISEISGCSLDFLI